MNDEAVIKFFEEIEKAIMNKRDMRGVNEFLNLYLKNVSRYFNADFGMFEFDKQHKIESDRDLNEVAYQKALFIYSPVSGTSYTEIAKNPEKELEVMRKIPFIKSLIDYKFEHFGAEIFAEMGLEIMGFDKNGNLGLREREDMTPDQRKKFKEISKTLGPEMRKGTIDDMITNDKMN